MVYMHQFGVMQRTPPPQNTIGNVNVRVNLLQLLQEAVLRKRAMNLIKMKDKSFEEAKYRGGICLRDSKGSDRETGCSGMQSRKLRWKGYVEKESLEK